MTAAQSWEGL